MDESAKATAIEIASAISRARAWVRGIGSEVMAAAYAAAAAFWSAWAAPQATRRAIAAN